MRALEEPLMSVEHQDEDNGAYQDTYLQDQLAPMASVVIVKS